VTVVQKGGYSRVQMYRLWDDVAQELRLSPYLNTNISVSLHSIYKRYLYDFEMWDIIEQSKGVQPILEQVIY
jgi:hypothetical protein